ncbi:MAG: hypothetical protein ACFCD0_27185 [Gemmataceae bacterium]
MIDQHTIPTQKDLESLPRWAKVAFAVQCAKLVFPVVRHEWPDVPEKHLEAWTKAIGIAEQLASDGGQTQTYAANAGNAAKAFYEAKAAAHAIKKETQSEGSFQAMMAGVYVAKAAAHYAQNEEDIFAAVEAAHGAAAAHSVGERFVEAVWRDFGALATAARKEEWTNNTPVPKSFFRSTS